MTELEAKMLRALKWACDKCRDEGDEQCDFGGWCDSCEIGKAIEAAKERKQNDKR